MIDFIDIVEFLREHDNKLPKIKIYGRVNKIMDKMPRSLLSSVVPDRNTVCVSVDSLAINLAAYRSELEKLGVTNPDFIYFTNGSISTFVSRNIVVGEWYTFEGTLRLAQKSSASTPVVAILNFYRTQDSKWGIRLTKTTDVDADFSSDSRVMQYLLQGDTEKRFISPSELEHITHFYDDEPDVLETYGQNNTLSLTDWLDKAPTNVSAMSNFKLVAEQNNPRSMTFKPIKHPMLSSIQKLCLSSYGNRDKFIENLKLYFAYDSPAVAEYQNYTFFALMHSLTIRAFTNAFTGGQVLKAYLTKFGANAEQIDRTVNSYSAICEVLTGKKSIDTLEGSAFSMYDTYFKDTEVLYAGVVAITTGVSFNDMVALASNLRQRGLSLTLILNRNPYLIGLLSRRLQFEVLEYLVQCFGLIDCETMKFGYTAFEARNMCAILDRFRYVEDGSTAFERKRILSDAYGIKQSSQNVHLIKLGKSILSSTVIDNQKSFINYQFDDDAFRYSPEGWFPSSDKEFERTLSTEEIRQGYLNLIECGAITEYTVGEIAYTSLTDTFAKEVYIYNRLNELITKDAEFRLGTIRQYIDDYERENGVILSSEQRNAVQLMRYRLSSVLGVKGAGKSRVVSCMKYVLNRLSASNKYEDYSPLRSTKGIQHISLYDSSKTAFIFNASYITMDELYRLLTKIETNGIEHIIFVGDIYDRCNKDGGLVLSSIIKMIPNVVLSGTYSDVLNEFLSNTSKERVSYINCDTAGIPIVTQLLCKYHTGYINSTETSMLKNRAGNKLLSMENLASRDIYISTNAGSESNCSAYNINNIVRDAFNNKPSVKIIWGTDNNRTTYHVGDRVVCTRTIENIQRFNEYSQGKFRVGERSSLGVYEGTIGAIVGLISSTQCEFQGVSADARPEKEFIGGSKYFIVVCYYDTLSSSMFYVAYRAIADSIKDSQICRVFTSEEDADAFKLAYCTENTYKTGTTSKLHIAVVTDEEGSSYSAVDLYSQCKNFTEKLYIVGNMDNIIHRTDCRMVLSLGEILNKSI